MLRRVRATLPLLGIFLALVALPTAALAESDYDRARSLALSGERDAAREMCHVILADNPGHVDARILLGRLYAWDGRYEEAREQLLDALRRKPDYADARNALVDVELWSDHPARALELVDEGLRREPTHADFLYKRGRALVDLGRDGEAGRTVDRLLRLHPTHERGNDLFRSLRKGRVRHSFALDYGYTDVDTLSDPWHEASLALKTRTGIGTVIGRVNYANRFAQSASQYEIDAYPSLASGVYAYLNYGYSDDSLYPRHRYGAELYAGLPGSFELSGGFRRLEFASTDVTIYTGSLAKYVGNWWISLRPYVTPKDEGTSRSYNLAVRRYLGSADSFLELSAGTGSSPDDIETTVDLARLDSWKVGARLEQALGDLVILKLRVGYDREEFAFDRIRRELGVTLGIERRF